MKIIEKLSQMIDEEIEDAEKYAKCAVKYKQEYPVVAKTFYELSMEELRHMEMLHQNVVRIITEYRQKNGEPPVPMMAVYTYLHERSVEKVAKVKVYQSQYAN